MGNFRRWIHEEKIMNKVISLLIIEMMTLFDLLIYDSLG